MTFDWTDFADALRWLLLLLAAGWIFFAWLNRVEYRLALAVLAGLFVADWVAQAAAHWVVSADSNLPTDVPAYSTFVLVGAILGLVAAGWHARRNGISVAVFMDCAFVVVLVGAAGARLYHVLMHWDYYAQNGDAIANLAQGGMGIRGALLLGLPAMLLVAVLFHVSFWKLGDAAAIGLPLALSVGWYGANLTGVNYGVISDAPFAQDLPDLYGIIAPRVPVQLAAIVFFFVLWLALIWFSVRKHPRPGMLLLVLLILLGMGNFALDSQRADETLLWNGWRADQWVDLVLAASGFVVLWLRQLPIHWMKRQARVEEKA